MQKTARKNTTYSSLCMGYSVCKILNLDEKFILAKTCQNRLCKLVRNILCKKRIEKTPKIPEMRRFWKSAIFQGYSLCMGYSLCKILNLGQKFKLPKTCQNRFCKLIRNILCKTPLQKTPNIPEMRRFWNRPSCKGYRLCMGLCKILNLSQRFKLPKTCQNRFCKLIKNILCKTPLEKTPNIPEMRNNKETIRMHGSCHGNYGCRRVYGDGHTVGWCVHLVCSLVS